MNDFEKTDPEALLRRLGDALADEPPSEEEARRDCEAMGIDVDAVYARIMATVEAEERPPESYTRDRRTHAKVADPMPEDPPTGPAEPDAPRPAAASPRKRRARPAPAPAPNLAAVLERLAGGVPQDPVVRQRARRARRKDPRGRGPRS